MYRHQHALDNMKSFKCPQPDCGSKYARIIKGKLFCGDCGHLVGHTSEGKSNKFGAKRTEFKGTIYDSKFEASVASELDTRKLAGDIKDFDTQFKVEMWLHRPDGAKAFCIKHKVDFRIHHNDGSYELLEAKGVETQDYKMRRRALESVFLPMNPDYTYTVIKQQRRR